jgi:hypothetical protein
MFVPGENPEFMPNSLVYPEPVIVAKPDRRKLVMVGTATAIY